MSATLFLFILLFLFFGERYILYGEVQEVWLCGGQHSLCCAAMASMMAKLAVEMGTDLAFVPALPILARRGLNLELFMATLQLLTR